MCKYIILASDEDANCVTVPNKSVYPILNWHDLKTQKSTSTEDIFHIADV